MYLCVNGTCVYVCMDVYMYIRIIGKSSRYGFTEDDYITLLAKNPETLFQDESYMKHLRRNATKYACVVCVCTCVYIRT